MTPPDGPAELARCSFCDKPGTEVDKLVAGAGVHICNECAALATSVVEGSLGGPAKPRVPVWDPLTGAEMLIHIPASPRTSTRPRPAFARGCRNCAGAASPGPGSAELSGSRAGPHGSGPPARSGRRQVKRDQRRG